MADSIDELIREIAGKHGIAVSRDDPIFVLQTVNQRLLDDGAKAQRELLERYKEDLEVISKRWGDEAKQKAERILNAALGGSRQAMTTTMEEATKAIVAAARREIDLSLGKLDKTVRQARWLVLVNLTASVMTLAAMVMAVNSMLR
jgi:glutathione S-transferase